MGGFMFSETLGKQGEVLYVYSGSDFTYFVVRNSSSIKLVTVDKRTKEVLEKGLYVPDEFLNADSLVFFKPKENKDHTLFSGFIIFEDKEDYHFSFTNKSYNLRITPRLKDKNDGLKTNISYKLSEALEGIKINQQIQKANEMYFVGEYEQGGVTSPCFGELTIVGDRLKRLYFIYSDLGEVKLNSIGIDLGSNQILIAGCVKDEGNFIPYVESFEFEAR